MFIIKEKLGLHHYNVASLDFAVEGTLSK